MSCELDRPIPIPGDSEKWRRYEGDVLPLWVADMDFASPEPVRVALLRRINEGIFGYPCDPAELRLVLCERLQRLYAWRVLPEAILFLPGVVTGFNLACRAVAAPGDGVLVQTPIYPPIWRAPGNAGLALCQDELLPLPDGRYELDIGRFESAITSRTRLFILCNPHNPVGRVFRREELARMAEVCLRHDMVICSDEIHGDLVFSGSRHVPIAGISPEIARRTITLMAPSKTFNMAGLRCSFAVIEDAELRRRFLAAKAGLVSGVNVLGYCAALAAYREGQPWLDELLAYLEANRDFLAGYVRSSLPGIRMSVPEGTYLAWLDCRDAGLPCDPRRFFLERAGVALNAGPDFGPGGEGFIRLNFACPRSTLEQALERMRRALHDRR